jgi:hypothetical protein
MRHAYQSSAGSITRKIGMHGRIARFDPAQSGTCRDIQF